MAKVRLSFHRKGLAAEKGSKRLEEAFENKDSTHSNSKLRFMDGGLGVVVDEARVFIPASLVSDTL